MVQGVISGEWGEGWECRWTLDTGSLEHVKDFLIKEIKTVKMERLICEVVSSLSLECSSTGPRGVGGGEGRKLNGMISE